MARELSWSDVRGGMLALLAIIVLAFVVLRFSRVGALHGDTLRVYVLVGEARGATPGSEVWLSGQKIGKITSISFRPAATSDTSARLLVELQVLSEYRDAVHADATAQVRSGGSIIGAAVVYLTPGTARAPMLADGDTLRAEPQGDLEEATAQFSNAARDVPVILGNVSTLVDQMKSTGGTVGAALHGSLFQRLGDVKLRTLHVADRLHSEGTVGRVMQGGLSTRVSRVMARVDSVRALMASPRTSLGRLRKDSTLTGEIADIQHELTLVQRNLEEPSGTAGRVLRDSAVVNGIASAQHELTLLLADLKQHPFRYISF